jgi:hypothetical protein
MEVILLLLVSIPVSQKVQPAFQHKRDIHNISNYTKPMEKMDGADITPEISHCLPTTVLISSSSALISQSKALVCSKVHHVVLTVDIPVNKMSRQQEGNVEE